MRPWTQSLTFRGAAVVVSIQLLFLVFLGYFYTRQFSEQVDRRSLDRVKLPAAIIAGNALNFNAFGDASLMRDILGTEFVEAMAVDANGRVLHSLHPAQVGKSVQGIPNFPGDIPFAQITTQLIYPTRSQGNTYLNLLEPMKAVDGYTPFVYIYLKVRTTQDEREKSWIAWMFGLGSGICLIISSALLIAAFRFLAVHRLRRLLDALHQIAVGNLNVRVSDRHGGDEIGVINAGFNQMSEVLENRLLELEAAQRKLRQLNESLELRVENRTRELKESKQRLEQELAERRHAEEAVRVLNATLERRVAERTEELAGVNARMMEQITQLTEAEHALRQAEEKYRDIVEKSVEGIYQSTPDGRFMSVNPAMAAILGFDAPEELLSGVTDIARQLHADPQRRVEFMQLMEANGAVNGFEYECVRRDGTRVWLSTSARAVRDASGKVLYYDGINHDITARKVAEDLLRILPMRILDAQENERRRVSRDLHDGVSQILASLRFRMQALSVRAENNPDLITELARTRELIQEASQAVRRISRNLRPSELDDLGLESAIRTACEDFEERTNCVVDCEIGEPLVSLEPDRELHLYRVFQEALNNVEKHAAATHVSVELGQCKDQLVLVIADNGVGFAADDAQEFGGLGLQNMRERASLLGGSFQVRSRGGGGTRVEIKLHISLNSRHARHH